MDFAEKMSCQELKEKAFEYTIKHIVSIASFPDFLNLPYHTMKSVTVLHGSSFYKSNLHYTHGITRKRVTSGGAHLRGLARGQHSSKKTSLRCRVVEDTVSDLTDLGMESKTFRADSGVLSHIANLPFGS